MNLPDASPTLQCIGCGRQEAVVDVAWLTVYIAAGPCEVSVDVCTECQRTAKLTEEKLVQLVELVERAVRERLRFHVADAMMREEVRS